MSGVKMGDLTLDNIKQHFPGAEVIGIEPVKSLACFNCKREAMRGLSYRGTGVCAKCSPYSYQAILMRKAIPTIEDDGFQAGGNAGGEYLDGIGKTDLAQLSEEEWTEFLNRIFDGYSDFMRQKAADEPPF